MEPTNLVLLGDSTGSRASVQALVRHSKTSAGARRLLQEATDLVQLYINRFSKDDGTWDHDARTLMELTDESNAAIAAITTCVAQLGDLIVYAEANPTFLGTEHNPVQVLGFCTGLFPAAALVAARDTNELFELGMEIISIIIRFAHAGQERAALIEDTPLSWSTTLIRKTPAQVQPILDDFHRKKNIPYPKRVAIAVVSSNWLTLTGAPSSLASLMEFSKALDEVPKIDTLESKGGHMEFLPPVDIDTLLGDSPLLATPITSKARILSPASCKPYAHSTLRSLLSEMLLDTASRVLRIDDAVGACITALEGKRPVTLATAGASASGYAPIVGRALGSRNIAYQSDQHRSTVKSIPSRGGSGLVAIVGMSARLPGSDTVDAFFEDLLQGKIQMKKIPKTRFDVDEYYDSTGKRQNSAPTDQGAFLEHPGYFDNRLFNISPREALQMDPVHRMLLTTSWEALEMAGYSRDATPSTRSNRIATYFGQTSDEWRDVLNTKDIDIYYVPGAGRCFAPARLAHHYKWGGGTYALETGCSTSITAIHLACQALTSRECDTALAGGGSICISPTIFEAMCKCGMVSSRGGCRTFHDDADGYVRGEGIGVVVLKRLEDAMADNDNVLGVIRGHARTHQSASVSITNPSAESQSSLFQDVLWQTATEPGEIAYVELHGTGTQAGDVAEMTSVVQVLGQQRSKKNVLTVGAVKANVGHGEATAGVTALIKVLMMMKQRKIAPQPGLPFKINRKLPNLGPLHVRIAGTGSDDNLTLRPSPASADGKIKCMINSFDSAGGSTALLVEEPPKRPGKTDNPLPCHIVALSARTLTSLQQNRKRLLDYLIRSPETKLADLAYTTTARRMHEVLRVAYTGRSTKEVVEKLIKDVSLEAQNDPKKKAPPMSVVFAFTGQGSPYVGMGRQLYQHNTALRGWLHSYQQVAEHQGLPRFLHIISDDNADLTASSVIVQLALVALEIATARLLRAWGVKPNMIIGHSLGEYSALCVAGVLSVSDTLYLVGQRAQLMERKLVSGEYAMLAIDRGPDAAQQLLAAEAAALSSRTEIACVNAPDATVISGPISEVEHVKSVLEKEGSRSKVLQTQYGFHSHHVDAIIFDFKAIAKRASFSAPETPIASTSLGRVIEAGTHDVFSPDYLAQHARERVNFAGAVQAYQAHSLAKSRTAWIEIGPEPVCIGLARRTLKVSSDLFLPTIKATENNWVTVSSALASLYQAGVTINWVAYHSCFASSLSLLPLPTYAFDEKNYWTPYVKSVHLAHPLPQADEIRKGSDLNTPPSFSTTSLQLLEKESVEQDSVSVTFASRTSEHGLCEAIKGHVVNGVPVASLSILYDMAKSAATYAYRKLHPAQKMPSMTICNVDLKQAIILSKDGHEQIIKTKVSLSGSTNAFVSFSSVQGAVCAEHGSMRVAFEDVSTWFGQQSQMSLLVDARIQALKDNASMGIAHRLMKPAVYRLFDNVVSYGKNYQAMEEVWLDAECRDAAGIIKLPKITAAGNFLHNPFWADGATHIAGFLVNCGLKYDQDVACFCPAVESWHVLEELRADEVYTAYTTVQDTTANVLSGSVYVYDSKRKLVQVLSGICFRKTTKIALGEVLATRPTPTALSAMPTSVERSMLPRLEPPDSNVTVSSSATDVGDDSDIDQDKLGVITISGGSSTAQSLFSIILSECGLSEAEIEPSTAFHDLGLDSLMAITILSTFRMKTEIELPPTFFMDHQTVAEAREALLVS